KKHEREWLGDLAPHLLDTIEVTGVDHYDPEGLPKPEFSWRNGFLSSLTIPRMTTALAQTLADAPAARFLRELQVHHTVVTYYGHPGENQPPFRVPTPPEVRHNWELFELIGAACLRTVRAFQMGGEVPPEDGWCDCNCYTEGLEHVIASMPRIEELHLY